MLKTCQYGHHQVDTEAVGQLYYYADVPHGVPEGTHTCHACYLAHLVEFYPDSDLTQRLVEQER